MSQSGPASRKNQPSFMSIMLTEMGVRMGLFLLAMVLAFIGSAVARGLDGGTGEGWLQLLGALAGLAIGAVIYAIVMRKFNARPKPVPPTGLPTP